MKNAAKSCAFSSIRIRSFQTYGLPVTHLKNCFALLVRLSNRLPPVRLQKSQSVFFFRPFTASAESFRQRDSVCLAESSRPVGCIGFWSIALQSCSGSKPFHRWRRWPFSAQLSESWWGESSQRSRSNYVALERYLGNRQLASSTLARMCMCQWCAR